MNGIIEKLILALEKDCEIYTEVLRLGEMKKDIIIKGDIDELDKITKREHALIASLMKLEEIRDKIVTEIMKETGLQKVDVIDDITKVVDAGSREKIQAVKRKLENLMSDVRDVNESNGELIKQSMDMIEFNVNLISSIDEAETNYGDKANINYQKKRPGSFDAKA